MKIAALLTALLLVPAACGADPPPDKVITIVITIRGGGSPAPPAPPIPPAPADTFAAALRAAYDADTGPTKVDDVATLAALYLGAASTKLGDVPTTRTVALLSDLSDKMAAAGVALVPADRLKGVRDVIAVELFNRIGADGMTPLDAAVLGRATAQFARVSDALAALAPDAAKGKEKAPAPAKSARPLRWF